MNRRKFIAATALGSAAVLTPDWLKAANAKTEQPDIIYIFTDQQSASMMSCAGNKWLKTPAMDYIATNGMRFERAYTTNPVCSPARVSFMTGRFPGSFKTAQGKPARENDGSMSIPQVSDKVAETTIAAFLKKADYELVYGGKKHLPQSLTPQALDFRMLNIDQRDDLADSCAGFIKEKHAKPYFMVASFINPHDICYMALNGLSFDHPGYPPEKKIGIAQRTLVQALKLPEGVTEDEFFAKHCPPLPENFEPQQDEPQAITSLLTRRKFRMHARKNYSERDWRLHRWAYCRLTELVDRQIQTLLDALKESGRERDTLIIFSSDHGDMDSAHRSEHKTMLYEEAANIPFMAMWKGHIPAGRVDKNHLISNGLDLLPTLCDYAGVKGVSDPRGRSLRPLFEGKSVAWRKTLGVESEIGRMVVDSNKCKYIKYDAVGKEEQLLDLKNDPHEMRHFTDEPEYASRLAELRKSFQSEWFPGQ